MNAKVRRDLRQPKAVRSDKSPPDCLRVAIISDVHAYDGIEPDKAPSHCCITETDPSTNPLVGLRDLIKRETIHANVLLCPGDLGDKAQPSAIQYAWNELHALKRLLNANQIVATTGNHDIDSRHAYNHHDAKGHLQSLSPTYPFARSTQNDKYWARHFATIVHRSCRIVSLNSSAFHGEGRFDEIKRYEYEQGRVSQYTLQALRAELVATEKAPINILLCHHHPHLHSELRLAAEDLMLGGYELLNLLGSGNLGRWMIIHGHKHHPKLEYSAGGNTSPIVFAAGSVASVFYRELQTAARNQFYVLEFPLAGRDSTGIVGRFRSWDWATGHGWIAARPGSGLPASGGFGWRGDIDELAKQIAAKVQVPSKRWIELKSDFPMLDFLLPQDLKHLIQCLMSNGLIVDPIDTGPPVLVGKPT